MATPEEISQLRINIAEPDAVAPYTDQELRSQVDARGVRLASADIWLAKAAIYAEMVDTSEAGSSRPLSSLHKNALSMHEYFLRPEPTVEVVEQRVSRSRRAERV